MWKILVEKHMGGGKRAIAPTATCKKGAVASAAA